VGLRTAEHAAAELEQDPLRWSRLDRMPAVAGAWQASGLTHFDPAKAALPTRAMALTGSVSDSCGT
jgi:hypothetical protein